MIEKILDYYFTNKLIKRVIKSITFARRLKITFQIKYGSVYLYFNFKDKKELKKARYFFNWEVEESLYNCCNYTSFCKTVESCLNCELENGE